LTQVNSLAPAFWQAWAKIAMKQLDAMRVHYDRDELRREDLCADPIEQFAAWMNEACEAGLVEPNAMSLATVGTDGRPTLRTVLLKGFDGRGFVCYTNVESRKARQISENTNVSLLFPWLALHRQVAINGVAERVPTSEALAYFVTRPFGSQIGPWASPQSQVVSARALLEMNWEEAKQKFQEGRVPMPSCWGGFRVVPRDIEFWQGRGHRLHDRFLYTRLENGSWKIERLAP
jgi:pyridoxamine 5'-phosphate oxidase